MKTHRPLAVPESVFAAIVLLAVAVSSTALDLFGRVDNLIYDLGQRLAEAPPPDDIVIVAIDETSLSQLGRWPWSRRLHAALIDQLREDGARVVALDIIFAEPDTADPGADAALAEAIGRAGNVVLPILLESSRVNGQLLETPPLPQLMTHAAGLGRVHAELDPDGIARSIYLWEGVGTPFWPHFGQAVLEVARLPAPGLRTEPPRSETVDAFALVRAEPRRVRFLGAPGHMKTLSYVQVLTGDFPPGTFRSRIVLVGATAAGMGDVLPTPVSGLAAPMSGVEFNANVVASMRSGLLVRDAAGWLVVLVAAVVSILPLVWLPRLDPLPGLVTSLVWALAVAVSAALLPVVAQVWVPVAGAVFAILLAFPLWSWRALESANRFLDQELEVLRGELGAVETLDGKRDAGDRLKARIRRVQAAAERLRALQTEKREMLAFLSHDLRAPLATALLRAASLPPDLRAQVESPIARSHALAEAFLQASRAEMFDPARFEELDLTAVVHQAVDDCWSAAQTRAVQLVRSLPDEPVWVNGSFDLLHRAVTNLVQNALHHAPTGTAVEVRLALEPQCANIEVIDTGEGIDPAMHDRLFQRFATGRAGGSGLGLYFVKTVAVKHGGTAQVTSLPGETRFVLRLPRVQH